ncbi:MAG: hypothetical protein ACLP7P_05205 [Rhodomicrobium sp.]
MAAGAGAAAAAAANAREEEEEMTPYSSKDLAEGWEFKILRNTTGRFSDPFWLRSVLEEEGRAGWVLIEKFDNYRVRLKRPVSARANDASLGFDPYRTWVGIGQARFAILLVAGITLGVALFTGALVALLTHFGAAH